MKVTFAIAAISLAASCVSAAEREYSIAGRLNAIQSEDPFSLDGARYVWTVRTDTEANFVGQRYSISEPRCGELFLECQYPPPPGSDVTGYWSWSYSVVTITDRPDGAPDVVSNVTPGTFGPILTNNRWGEEPDSFALSQGNIDAFSPLLSMHLHHYTFRTDYWPDGDLGVPPVDLNGRTRTQVNDWLTVTSGSNVLRAVYSVESLLEPSSEVPPSVVLKLLPLLEESLDTP